MLKLILKLLQHVSVPLDHHQGARRSYPKVTTDHLLVLYTVVLQQQNHSVISGNFGIGTTCSLMMVQWDRNMLE